MSDPFVSSDVIEYDIDNVWSAHTAVNDDNFTSTCPDPRLPAHRQTCAAAHIGHPRFPLPHCTQKRRTSSEASENGDGHRTKLQCLSPKPRREMLVEGLKIDAHPAASGGEVDLLLLVPTGCQDRSVGRNRPTWSGRSGWVGRSGPGRVGPTPCWADSSHQRGVGRSGLGSRPT